VATTANITLSGLQTIDGIALADGDRVLVKDQTNTVENGIYLARASAWERAKDFNGNRDAVRGTMVLVQPATDSVMGWVLTTENPVVIGVSELVFEPGINSASLITFLPDVAGAVSGTVQDKLREINSRADAGVSTPNPRLGIGVAATSTNVLVMRAQTDVDTGIGSVLQVQHLIETDESGSQANPKALRAYTRVGSPTNALVTATAAWNPWAVSGELDNYSDSTNTGATATSGVSNKFGAGAVWAGHFQSKEWTDNSADPTQVTDLLGIEANLSVVGADHPTDSNGLGNRFLVDLIAKSNKAATGWAVGKEGEVGCAIRIRTEAVANGGYFRYGIVLEEHASNAGKINTGILVRNTGAYGLRATGAKTTADISLEGNSQNGILLQGTYTGAAIRINDGQRIGLEATNAIKFGWDSGSTSVQMLNGANNRVSFNLSASPGLRINATQVVGARDTGWNAMTGSSDKGTAYDTATVTLPQLAGRVMALQAALTTHGLLGA
jgi:hypothetical protein